MHLQLHRRKPRAVRREDVTEAEWRDWRWQLQHRLETLEEIEQFVDLTEDERRGIALAPGLFRIGITPYYAALMDRAHATCPVRMQVIPVSAEEKVAAGEYVDPLGEDALMPEGVSCIVHRYPDRVLFLALDRCAIYCRHCNRRRMVGQDTGMISREQLERGLDYLRRTPAVKDVLISGGDPLTLSTAKLEWLVSEVRAIEHVEIIRIGTRVPVCLPMRIDAELTAMLKKYHPLYVNTHFNHPKELTDEARASCAALADAGIPLGNQCVLLRGVNSQPRTIEVLNRALLKTRVKPYYLFQGDPVQGTDHLRTPVQAGLDILEHLRGRITGMGIPQFVIDAPGGGGKIPLVPNYRVAQGEDRLVLRTTVPSVNGGTVEYVEPQERDCTCAYDEVYFSGVSGLVGDCACDPPLAATARALAVERADDVVYGLGLLALARDGKRATELTLLARHDDAEAALREAVARAEARVEVVRVPDAWPARLPASTLDASALVHAADLARGRPDRVYLTVAGAVAAPAVMAVAPSTPAAELVARAGGALDDDWVPIANGAPAGRLVERTTPAVELGALLLVLPARHQIARRLRTPIADWLVRAASACEGCRVCTDSCPDGVPAHEVIWTLATMRDDGVELARAAGCTACGLCDVMCPSALSPARLVGNVRDRLNLDPPPLDPTRALVPGLDLALLTLRLGLGEQVTPEPRIH